MCVCVCVYLFRQGAAVLLGHAFPHGLLDRLDLLPQRNTRGVGRLDHLTIDCLLVLTLRGERERERKRGNRREAGWRVRESDRQGKGLRARDGGGTKRLIEYIVRSVSPHSTDPQQTIRYGYRTYISL